MALQHPVGSLTGPPNPRTLLITWTPLSIQDMHDALEGPALLLPEDPVSSRGKFRYIGDVGDHFLLGGLGSS